MSPQMKMQPYENLSPYDCIPLFNRLQSEHSPKYIIYTITTTNPSVNLITVLKSSPTRDYASFLSDLPDKECRYGVFSFGDDQNDTVFITWVPEGAKAEERKMFLECSVELWGDMFGLRPIARFDEVRGKAEILEEVVRKRISIGL
ncbi:cofilin [Orbilia javanica]|uniref:Cofilin n=1 Tax=Orbilia javanica TaxID=47235 RepID=A0AAN8NGB6_9PEZI